MCSFSERHAVGLEPRTLVHSLLLDVEDDEACPEQGEADGCEYLDYRAVDQDHWQ